MRHNKKFVFKFKKSYVLKISNTNINTYIGDSHGFSFKKL